MIVPCPAGRRRYHGREAMLRLGIVLVMAIMAALGLVLAVVIAFGMAWIPLALRVLLLLGLAAGPVAVRRRLWPSGPATRPANASRATSGLRRRLD